MDSGLLSGELTHHLMFLQTLVPSLSEEAHTCMYTLEMCDCSLLLDGDFEAVHSPLYKGQ